MHEVVLSSPVTTVYGDFFLGGGSGGISPNIAFVGGRGKGGFSNNLKPWMMDATILKWASRDEKLDLDRNLHGNY